MLRELESPGFVKILIYLAVFAAVGMTLLVEFGGQGILLSYLQGAFLS